MTNKAGDPSAALKSDVLLFPQPALRLIYDAVPIGLACLSLDCRYLQINQRLTEFCGISKMAPNPNRKFGGKEGPIHPSGAL